MKTPIKSLRFTAILFFLVLFYTACENNRLVKTERSGNYTFVYLTDIHLQPEQNATEAFQMVIDTINGINPDFVINGGDMIMDALGQSYERSDSLYNMYAEMSKQFNMPVYNTMGNHEIFGLYEESGIKPDHPVYNEKLYEERLGDKYYSFDHKNWHYIILDGIGQTKERKYIGEIDSIQMEWIKEDLKKVDPSTPIAISTHIPFISVMAQMKGGSMQPNTEGLVVHNSKEVLELFKDHNLKLVLQGHLHYLEDIYAEGVHFITGGAVSGKWWTGPRYGVEEGFLKIRIKNGDINWEYIDYGWEATE